MNCFHPQKSIRRKWMRQIIDRAHQLFSGRQTCRKNCVLDWYGVAAIRRVPTWVVTNKWSQGGPLWPVLRVSLYIFHEEEMLWETSAPSLRWRHNENDGVSNHQPHDCLLNHLSKRRSKKTSKLRVTGLSAGNSPVTGEFPAQKASNAENVSISWRHHDDDVMTWKRFPYYWSFLRGSTGPGWILCKKARWCGAWIFPLSHWCPSEQTAEQTVDRQVNWDVLILTLQWRHNGNNSVWNHQPNDCLFNRLLFRRRSKKTSKLCVTGLCAGNSPVTGEFPAEMASNAEKVNLMTSSYFMIFYSISLARIYVSPVTFLAVTFQWPFLTT